MGLFSRNRSGHPLINADSTTRLARYGQDSYNGTRDVWDMWPADFGSSFTLLTPEEKARCLRALVAAVVPGNGWATYGAERMLDADLATPGSGDSTRDALLTASLEFQRAGGVWWSGLSIVEQEHWRRSHPDEPWALPRELPTREQVTITPLAVGADRKLTLLTRAADSKGFSVERPDEARYVLFLDFVDDDNVRRRDYRTEAPDLYTLYCDVARNLPYVGVWADAELDRFLPYPAPRL